MRGVVEGFYGPPWSPADRVSVLAFLASRGMNAYVYAPKDDPRHRSRWRDPYPIHDFEALTATAQHCRDMGVRFAYAISPGLDIDYHSPDDRAALWAKLGPFVDAGIDWLVLAFDDVPSREGAGDGQSEIVRGLRDRTDARLTVVPTDYVGTHPTPYLDSLCAGLPADVDLMWTGPTVVSPVITRADAEARRAATAERALLIWDNYPVNNAFMTASLHLGPLVGRDPGLSAICEGILSNPMPLAHASLVALATAADYFADPSGYDPWRAWDTALDDVAACAGGSGTAGLRALALACSSSILAPRVDLHRHLDAWEKEGFALTSPAATAVEEHLDAALALPHDLPAAVGAEVRPWADQANREAQAGIAALRAIRASSAETVDDSVTDASGTALAVLGALYLWNSARSRSDKVAFGPRFACYPGLVSTGAGAIGVDPDLSLVENANAIDRLCRIALDRAGTRSP